MSDSLQIDIVSDVSCPWCIIGYQSLLAALAKLAPDISASISWKPFELNPAMPPAGQNLGEHLHEKYGSTPAEVKETRKMITLRGAALGFKFDFRDDGRIYNTFDAHRLLYWARKYEKQTALKLALFNLYFTEGGNPSDKEQLLGAVIKAGLPAEEARHVLDTEQLKVEVREEIAKYQAMDIHSVPTFIINEKYKISGGLPVDSFVKMLEKIVGEEATSV